MTHEEFRQKQLDRMSDENLLKEYSTGMKHCFSKVFGGNARRDQNQVANTLLSRGITELPNLFGPIKISNNW